MVNFEKELNQDQYQAVTHPGGPLLILAGAGSGKTRALTYRAAYLIQEKGVAPDQILLLTFTNKAAGEMQERLKKSVGATLPFAGTFHSFCAKFLRREGIHAGINSSYVIYDDSDQIELVKMIIKDLELPKQFRPRSVLGSIASIKHELITPDEYVRLAQGFYQQQIAVIYQRYQQQLARNQALDFDDLLIKTVEILQTVTEVRERYQRRFLHVLIDEYQDTNRAQYLMAKLIAEGSRNLTVVGDASQSIYRWRGADYRNLEYLQNDFPELTTVKLEQNYRSTQTILDAAHSVISHNTSHPILSLWTDQKKGKKLKLFEADDEKDEAAYVLDRLMGSTRVSSAVLYRTNAQSRALEEALIRAGVAYTLVGGTKFYERQEIKDVLSYMRLLQNPSDSVSLARAQKLGQRRLAQFMTRASELDIANTVSSELFDQVLQATGYLDKYDPKIEAELARIENVKELRSVATQFENLSEFLENVALVENEAARQHDQDHAQVTLMTIHSSKGLEFDQVFVVGLEEGVFPHSRSLMEQAELEEERRLCYVAMTRARDQLFLSYARQRLFYGGQQQGLVSRFVGEIPETLLDSVGTGTGLWSGRASKFRKPTTSEDDELERFLADELDIEDFLK